MSYAEDHLPRSTRIDVEPISDDSDDDTDDDSVDDEEDDDDEGFSTSPVVQNVSSDGNVRLNLPLPQLIHQEIRQQHTIPPEHAAYSRIKYKIPEGVNFAYRKYCEQGANQTRYGTPDAHATNYGSTSSDSVLASGHLRKEVMPPSPHHTEIMMPGMPGYSTSTPNTNTSYSSASPYQSTTHTPMPLAGENGHEIKTSNVAQVVEDVTLLSESSSTESSDSEEETSIPSQTVPQSAYVSDNREVIIDSLLHMSVPENAYLSNDSKLIAGPSTIREMHTLKEAPEAGSRNNLLSNIDANKAVPGYVNTVRVDVSELPVEQRQGADKILSPEKIKEEPVATSPPRTRQTTRKEAAAHDVSTTGAARRKRGRPRLCPSVKKENQKRSTLSRVYIRDHLKEWNNVKEDLGCKTDREVAGILLSFFKKHCKCKHRKCCLARDRRNSPIQLSRIRPQNATSSLLPHDSDLCTHCGGVGWINQHTKHQSHNADASGRPPRKSSSPAHISQRYQQKQGAKQALQDAHTNIQKQVASSSGDFTTIWQHAAVVNTHPGMPREGNQKDNIVVKKEIPIANEKPDATSFQLKKRILRSLGGEWITAPVVGDLSENSLNKTAEGVGSHKGDRKLDVQQVETNNSYTTPKSGRNHQGGVHSQSLPKELHDDSDDSETDEYNVSDDLDCGCSDDDEEEDENDDEAIYNLPFDNEYKISEEEIMLDVKKRGRPKKDDEKRKIRTPSDPNAPKKMRAIQREKPLQKCSFCDFECERLIKLMEHRKAEHNISKFRKYTCELCHANLYTKNCLQAHRSIEHDTGESYEEKLCSICGKKFIYMLDYRVHQKTHKEKTYCCTYDGCPYKFHSNFALKSHMRATHLGDKRFKCEYDGCTKSYEKKEAIEDHINAVHLHLKVFKCEWEDCGKAFSYKKNLDVHMRIHKSTPYLHCDYCDYTCYQRAALNWHMKKHPDVVLNYHPLPRPGRVPKPKLKDQQQKQDLLSAPVGTLPSIDVDGGGTLAAVVAAAVAATASPVKEERPLSTPSTPNTDVSYKFPNRHSTESPTLQPAQSRLAHPHHHHHQPQPQQSLHVPTTLQSTYNPPTTYPAYSGYGESYVFPQFVPTSQTAPSAYYNPYTGYQAGFSGTSADYSAASMQALYHATLTKSAAASKDI